jgi:hypothetical protein
MLKVSYPLFFKAPTKLGNQYYAAVFSNNHAVEVIPRGPKKNDGFEVIVSKSEKAVKRILHEENQSPATPEEMRTVASEFFELSLLVHFRS